jgi:DNA topoisomerase-6 subunit B
MGISKKEVKEQFANPDTKSDRAVELLPIHIFFHICSTKIPYKTAGKESIASEGDLKRYMKICLGDLYRKVSAQIRKELRLKEAQSRLHLYKYYIPLIVNAISESIKVNPDTLSEAFTKLAEEHVNGEINHRHILEKQDKITGERIEEEVHEIKDPEAEISDYSNNPIKSKSTKVESRTKKLERAKRKYSGNASLEKEQTTLDALNTSKKMVKKR